MELKSIDPGEIDITFKISSAATEKNNWIPTNGNDPTWLAEMRCFTKVIPENRVLLKLMFDRAVLTLSQSIMI